MAVPARGRTGWCGQPPGQGPGLTPPPQAFSLSLRPRARMFLAAFRSRSCTVPHAAHVQVRTPSGLGGHATVAVPVSASVTVGAIAIAVLLAVAAAEFADDPAGVAPRAAVTPRTQAATAIIRSRTIGLVTISPDAPSAPYSQRPVPNWSEHGDLRAVFLPIVI
jgi:hypothetical protein